MNYLKTILILSLSLAFVSHVVKTICALYAATFEYSDKRHKRGDELAKAWADLAGGCLIVGVVDLIALACVMIWGGE